MKNQEQETDESAPPGFYPIRTVASLTGVNPITLRAWERRYGLLKPHRTPSGHRLYTQEDVDLINEAVRQLHAGINIGHVKAFLEQRPTPSPNQTPTPDPWAGPLEHMLSAISRFDETRLEGTYDECLSLYPIDVVINRLIVPLLRELGQRWETGEGSIAEEHFFGVYLRNKLGARFHHHAGQGFGPRLLAACLPGEHHENGLLLFALAAQDRGYRVILLGADMPLRELALAAFHARAHAIVLSGSTPRVEGSLHQELATLVNDARVPVFVGGKVSTLFHDAIVAAGAHPIVEDLRSGLNMLDQELRNT